MTVLVGLRDELFIAIFKQTVANINPAAVNRAWEFLAICLAHFGPSLAFADYLEVSAFFFVFTAFGEGLCNLTFVVLLSGLRPQWTT